MNLRAIAHVFDGVAVFKVVVMDVEGGAACRDGAAAVFGDGDGAVADVVIDFNVFVVFKSKLDGEVGFDGVVMNVYPLGLAPLDSVIVKVGFGFGVEEAVVANLAILEPEGEDATAGDTRL